VAATTKEHEQSKADEILCVGQELIQTQGYDGFSFRDIADRVGIKSASIHYHFPTKADLALAATQRYRTDFQSAVTQIDDQGLAPLDRLNGFVQIFQDTLEKHDRVCLAGMLASEADSLPSEVRVEIEQFFIEQQLWLRNTIEDGIAAEEVAASVESASFAQMFLSALEGAMILARSMKQPEHLTGVGSELISLLRSNTTS